MRRRVLRLGTLLAAGLLTGCDSSVVPSDAGEPRIDAEAGTMAPDGGRDADVARDGGPDASRPSGPIFLWAYSEDTGGFLATFVAGAWSTPERAPPPYDATGVEALADGRGLAVARIGSSVVASMLWTPGSGWGAPVNIDERTIFGPLTPPARSPEGASFARFPSDPATGLPGQLAILDAFDASSSTWSSAETTSLPAASITSTLTHAASAEPFVFTYDARANRYSWAHRRGGAWTAPQDFGSTIPATMVGDVQATTLSPTGEVVAAYVTGTSIAEALVQLVRWDGSAWQSVGSLGIGPNAFVRTFALCPLSAGRVAVGAVSARTREAYVAIFDPASPDGPVASGSVGPGRLRFAGAPIAVASGSGGAVLEVVYVDEGTSALVHARLTDEARWSWTAPVVVDASRAYRSVALAGR